MQDSTSAAAAELITGLARAMHSVSLPADVIEEVLRAAANSLGLKVELMVLQTAVVMEFEAGNRRTVAVERLSPGVHWRLEKEHELMRLAHSLADGSAQDKQSCKTAAPVAGAQGPAHRAGHTGRAAHELRGATRDDERPHPMTTRDHRRLIGGGPARTWPNRA